MAYRDELSDEEGLLRPVVAEALRAGRPLPHAQRRQHEVRPDAVEAFLRDALDAGAAIEVLVRGRDVLPPQQPNPPRPHIPRPHERAPRCPLRPALLVAAALVLVVLGSRALLPGPPILEVLPGPAVPVPPPSTPATPRVEQRPTVA